MKYLIDSSAWIEYFSGSSSGEKVSKAIESKNEVYTTALNIGEVISLLKRGEDNFEMCYEGIIKRSHIIEVTPKIAKEAGILHGEFKKTMPNFSLADAIIIKTAESIQATILTKDTHLKKFPNSEFI